MRIILCEKNFVRFIFAALLLPAFLQMTIYSLRASAHGDLMCIGWVQLHMVTEIDLNCQKKLCKTYATLLLILIYFLAKHQFFNKANKPSNPNSWNEILFNPCNFLFPPPVWHVRLIMLGLLIQLRTGTCYMMWGKTEGE